jgi:oligopeptidase B
VIHARASGAVVWAGDESGFYYLIQNDQWRPYQLRWHALGSNPGVDPVLYEESNPGFFLSLDESADGAFLFLSAGDHQTQGQWVLPLSGGPEGELRCLVAPVPGREVEADHAHGRFWLRSNHEDPDFGVYTVPTTGPWDESDWQPLLPPARGRYLLGFALFEGFWARLERLEAQDRILWGAIPEPGALAEDAQAVPFPSALGQAGFGTNAWFAATTLRVSFSSMVDPPAVYDFEPATGALTCLKRRVVPGYAPEDFEQLRFWATSADGTAVPYTVARRRGAPPGPVHLYGYGAYGLGEMPSFSSARLLLLERGVTCVLAHVRGGDELGQRWYRAATGAGREHTFADFLAISEALLAEGLGERGRIALEGGSAGGELVAVALNRAPERWAAVFAAVPFVDVLHTMLDPELPLTPLEWPEWGNPLASRGAFDTIRAYCPYQNVRPEAFPPVLATAGVEDPRVGYWEPAKWIAALRDQQRGPAPLMLRTQFSAGHGGATGRYAGLDEVAEAYAFLLTALGA